MAKGQGLVVEGETVAVSNLEKVLYPGNHFTKAQVIDYYIRVSPFLLPHLKDRPVALKRYPDGVRGEFFYEKDAPGFTPAWVKTFPVPRRGDRGEMRYILINDLRTLVWCANLANLEIHPFLHRVPEIGRPSYVVFDLDPGGDADVLTCAEVAFLLKDVLGRMKLECYPKVSGSKGLQVYVPLNTGADYAITQPFARTLAELIERQHPEIAVSEMAKEARGGKVFIDWSQNTDYKTTIGVYSLRAKRDVPYVSLPVTWQELKRARRAEQLYFEPDAALARFEKHGDLFAPVLTQRQTLPQTFTKEAERWSRGHRPKSLEAYDRKRDFSKTPEPAGAAAPRRAQQGGRRRFVVQKHAASHLHYDVRLEMHDVLRSWAVPKGVPYSPEEKRLAMATEDHPIEYLDFEGTIPEGQYGGGTVMVWDIGTYEVIDGNYFKGKLNIHLEGKKLRGEWVLVKDRSDPAGKKWLLMKAGEPMKPPAKKRENTSALSGRTMEQIAAARERVWQSNRTASGAVEAPELDRLPAANLNFVLPMRALGVGKLPEGGDRIYEIKLDGYRALAIKAHGVVRLLSRNGNDFTARFAPVAQACEDLTDGTMLDGEIVALDEAGRPSFNLLQHYTADAHAIAYFVFDLLAWRGKSLLGLPLRERRRLLETAIGQVGDPVRLSPALDASAKEIVRAAKQQGLEGIVAKDARSVYEPGERTGKWVKFKVNKSHELVVGGYLPGKHGFDSLLAGYYRGRNLIFIAKIRNGFVPAAKKELMRRFRGLGTATCPFANLPEPKTARRGEALTAEVMQRCCWLKPKLVAQVEYTDWTAADHLRHSRFSGMREDKEAREVVKEEAA